MIPLIMTRLTEEKSDREADVQILQRKGEDQYQKVVIHQTMTEQDNNINAAEMIHHLTKSNGNLREDMTQNRLLTKIIILDEV